MFRTDTAKTIVVGVDGSPRSEDAVSFAGRLATGSGARLVLVYAYPVSVLGPGGVEGPELGDKLRRQAEAVLDGVRQTLPEDLAVTTEAVASVSPPRALHDAALLYGASLAVVGSSHVGPMGRITPGGTAERLLHGAPCAVAIVPADSRAAGSDAVDPIGVAYDGSPEARVALQAAVEACRAHGAELRVITVCDVGHYGAPALQYGPGFYADPDAVRARAQQSLDAVMAELPDDVDATPVLRMGVPAHELAAVSGELAMLFVGSRGYGPLRAVLLGGVGGALIRDTACPILVTPRGATVDAGMTTAAAAAVR